MDNFFTDVFGGGGGSQAQGTPSTAGAGDGAKGNSITNWLSTITGAYSAITGAGRQSGPAPVVPQPQPGNSKWLAIGGGLVLVVGLVLLLRK